MTPLTFVTWLWSQPGYRSRFSIDHVNVLFRMIDRHYQDPHRNVVVTGMARGIDRGVDVVPPWDDFADVPSPHGTHQPSCYRRLRAFHPDIGQVFGARFVSLDLDTVIVGDLAPLFDRPEDFVIWKEQDPRSYYNGSMFVLRAGARPQVWTTFNPRSSPQEAKAAGRFGSDQGHISHVLGRGEATWSQADGVYSYRLDIKYKGQVLPKNARVVHCHGAVDPWSNEMRQIPWVKSHWR